LIGSDTLHILANHWPSRRGGVLAGDELRQQVAFLVKQKVDSLFSSGSSGSKLIIVGDFNCTPDDQIMRSLIASDDPSKGLVNLSEILDNDGSGTYRYMGIWEMIDQVIVSRSLLSGEKGLSTEPNMLRIFKPEFLMKKDPKYPGLSPFSTYRGFKYQGGFSDHLPVYLDLTVK
jgi:endonuclease/exonuclease/phosphatase family metal-dependent hydrolase